MDMEIVWAESRGVPRAEVETRDEEGGGDTKTTRRSDNWARSQSAQSRRYMFGKGGPRPKAQATVK